MKLNLIIECEDKAFAEVVLDGRKSAIQLQDPQDSAFKDMDKKAAIFRAIRLWASDMEESCKDRLEKQRA